MSAGDGPDVQELIGEFLDVCSVPHPSGHVDQLAEKLVDRADSMRPDLIAERDEVGNVLITRYPDEIGKEDSLCVHGHLDMVGAKPRVGEFDYVTTPITPDLDGLKEHPPKLTAKGTSLGADDGVGIAAGMAIATDLKFLPGKPLEVLLTVDEETSMAGAKGLRKGWVKSKYLLNCDSENVGVITYGSCAGQTCDLIMDRERVKVQGCDNLDLATEVAVSGVAGGHSGTMISKYGANAIQILFRILDRGAELGGVLVRCAGGSAHNAIPTDASATLCFCMAGWTAKERFDKLVLGYTKGVKDQYGATDPEIAIGTQPAHHCVCHLSGEYTRRFIDTILALPHGVMRMSPTISNLVETSCNLAVIQFYADDAEYPKGDTAAYVRLSNRSSYEMALGDFARMLSSVARMSMIFSFAGGYDKYRAWKPDQESWLFNRTCELYREIVGKKLKTEVVHAGLECGEILAKYPGMQCVSVGPTITGAHTCEETLHVETCAPYLELVKAVATAVSTEFPTKH